MSFRQEEKGDKIECINGCFSRENPKIIPMKFLKHLEEINLSGT